MDPKTTAELITDMRNAVRVELDAEMVGAGEVPLTEGQLTVLMTVYGPVKRQPPNGTGISPRTGNSVPVWKFNGSKVWKDTDGSITIQDLRENLLGQPSLAVILQALVSATMLDEQSDEFRRLSTLSN